MSLMFTNLQRIVSEDISNRTNQLDVILEGITNAIHANADTIFCRLDSLERTLPTKQNSENESDFIPKIDTITIEDNGDGFTALNVKSFCEYRTAYKQKEFGCKGIGRLTFLKVYKEALIESDIQDEHKKKTFKFSFDFDSDNIKESDRAVFNDKTTIKLSNLRSNYFDGKHVDRRIPLDLNEIKNKILLNIIPTLFFYKKKGSNICITLVNESKDETLTVTNSDIPHFKEEIFTVNSKYEENFKFTLYYDISQEGIGTHAFYCANRRTVCEFHEKDLKLSIPSKYSAFLLLASPYLDDYVDNERNDFKINPKVTDLYKKLSWENINNSLKGKLSKIIKAEMPDYEETNRTKLKEIENERPYLLEYIEEEDVNLLGFVKKDQIIKKAKKRFENTKDQLIRHSGKKKYSQEDLRDAIQITQSELVAYIHDRTMVIERLKSMVNDHERHEKIIHSLFMEKQTDDNNYAIGKNNLWLLDDRFISYSYAASDKRIDQVLKNIDKETTAKYAQDRPDIALFFSHDPADKKGLKAVVIEIKPFDYKSKSSRQKFAGIQQLIDNIRALREAEGIEEIWAFLVTEIDEDLGERLSINGYTELFSTDRPIYHHSYKHKNFEASIHIVCAKTLVADAEARNKVFLNIINKHSRLKKLIS